MRVSIFTLFIVLSLPLTAVARELGQVEEESETKDYEVRASAGARSMLFGMWLMAPATVSIIVTGDILKYFRIQADVSPYSFWHLNIDRRFLRISLASGAAFKVYGDKSNQIGGWEVIIPAMVDLGYLSGEFEDGDGMMTTIKWLTIGPSSGVDFTWWSRKGIGFDVSLKVSYLFRKDVDSHYSDPTGNSYLSYTKNNFADIAVTFGVAI